MRRESTAALLLAGSLGLGGCATLSPRTDLARVEALTRSSLPAAVSSAVVEPGVAEEVRALLAQPLTAETAVRVAVLNNRELRASLRDIGISRGQLVQAGLLPNPGVELDVRQSLEEEQPLQADFLLEYDLTHALLTPLRTGVARADVEVARYRAASSVVSLGYQVREAFYAAVAAQERLALATRALDTLAAGRDAARALHEAGNLRELDLASQEAAFEDARATVAQTELEVLEQRERLQRLLGLFGDTTHWTLAPSLPAVQEAPSLPDDLERQAVEKSLELAQLRSRLESLSRRTALERTRGWLPDISVDVHAEQDGTSWEVGGGAFLTVPLFDRRQGAVAATEAEFDALAERLEGAAVDIRSAAREARNRLRTAHARARQYLQVIVPARGRVLQQTQLQYNAMQVGIFPLLEAHRGLLNAELARVSALQDYWTSRAALEALLQGQRAASSSSSTSLPSIAGAAEGAGGH